MDFLKEQFPNAQFGTHVNGDTEILVENNDYINVVKASMEAGYTYCSCLSAIDWKDRLTLITSLVRINPAEVGGKAIHIKVDLPRKGAHIASITPMLPGANYHEREAYDMYGIRFDGHPNHRRILLPDNWQGGHPLLKDFTDKRPKRPRLVRHRYAE